MMDLDLIFEYLGTLGAGNARTYDDARRTWLDENHPIPSFEECEAAWPATQLRMVAEQKLEGLQEDFAEAMKSGFQPSSLGLKTEADYDSITRFRDLVDLGTRVGLSQVEIRDYDGASHTVSLSALNVAVTELGAHYYALQQRLWAAEDILRNVTSIEEIANITF